MHAGHIELKIGISWDAPSNKAVCQFAITPHSYRPKCLASGSAWVAVSNWTDRLVRLNESPCTIIGAGTQIETSWPDLVSKN